MKKLVSLISLLLLAFLIFIIFLITPKNYETKYTINKIDIEEKYDKKNKYYYFKFTYEDKELEYLVKNKYINHRKLINDIKITDKEILELEVKSEYIKNIKLCYKDTQISCNYKEENNQEIISTYQDINIYNKDSKIYLWNYKGFIDINNQKTINVLDNEIYNPTLITKINNYLMLPDYDQEYNFNNIIYINSNNNKIKEYKIKYNISFDSYILGINKKSIYLMDKKNYKEYEIVVHKNKIRTIKDKLLINNEWNNINNEEIVNHEKYFTYDNLFNYTLDNNKLYLSYLNSNNKILIKENVKDIISTNNNIVYYLIEDTLYKYDIVNGNQKILKYFDLNFNYKNRIFIFE